MPSPRLGQFVYFIGMSCMSRLSIRQCMWQRFVAGEILKKYHSQPRVNAILPACLAKFTCGTPRLRSFHTFAYQPCAWTWTTPALPLWYLIQCIRADHLSPTLIFLVGNSKQMRAWDISTISTFNISLSFILSTLQHPFLLIPITPHPSVNHYLSKHPSLPTIVNSSGNRRGSGMTRQIWSTINTPTSVDKIWPDLIRRSNNDKEGSYTDASTKKVAAYHMVIS